MYYLNSIKRIILNQKLIRTHSKEKIEKCMFDFQLINNNKKKFKYLFIMKEEEKIQQTKRILI